MHLFDYIDVSIPARLIGAVEACIETRPPRAMF